MNGLDTSSSYLTILSSAESIQQIMIKTSLLVEQVTAGKCVINH